MIYKSSKNAYYEAGRRGKAILVYHQFFPRYLGKIYFYIETQGYFTCDSKEELLEILSSHWQYDFPYFMTMHNRKQILDAL
jgi:hypothetical protein